MLLIAEINTDFLGKSVSLPRTYSKYHHEKTDYAVPALAGIYLDARSGKQ